MSAHVLKVIVLGLCAAWLVTGGAGGCASQGGPRKEAPRVVVAADGGRFITAAELDELTRAFADRYVGLLASACDAVKKDNPDLLQRREAQVLLVDCASNMYDIASNADAFTRLLDMVVVTRLVSQVWVDDGVAQQVLGNRAEPVIHAMNHTRNEAQALAARVLTVEQLAVLDSLLSDWRSENPEMTRASFVRFSNFAIGRGRSAASEVLAARGFLAEVGRTGQAIDESRLLTERMFYQFKRAPTLLRWQFAAAHDELLANPETATALADLHRLTDLAERLPADIAAEREAIVAAVDSRMANIDATIAHVKDVVAESKALIASLEQSSQALDPLLKTADTLFARYDAWHRWAVANGRPRFDITQYTEMMMETATTAHDLDDLLKSSSELLASPDWRARIDEWNRAADGRIEIMAGQSRLLLNDLFRRVYIVLAVLFALLIAYRVISILLARRLAIQIRASGVSKVHDETVGRLSAFRR